MEFHQQSRRLRSYRLWAVVGCTAALFLLALTSFEIALVPTQSMENTVLVGDHVLVNKLFYGARVPFTGMRLPRMKQIRRGELVSFEHGTSRVVYLKRVVAVGGDTVEIRNGVLLVNGDAVAEQYVSNSTLWRTMKPRKVAAGELFVLGDNRDNSEDSRYWGTVPVRAVVGEPALVLWSFRERTSEWLDDTGNVRAAAYVNVARHFVTLTRWSRVATRL